MPKTSDEDQQLATSPLAAFSTPPAASSLPPLPPPPPSKVPITPAFALEPSSKYWYKYKTYIAPIPGTFDSCSKPNPYYRDRLKSEDESATRTEQLDKYHTYQEDDDIATAEAVVSALRSKQAMRKREVAKTQRFRLLQLRDRELERRERNVHIQELESDDIKAASGSDKPASDLEKDLFEADI